MALPRTTLDLLGRIPKEVFSGMQVVKDFGVFIDTHRDQPHVGSFHSDIHRGECRPTTVHVLLTIDPAGGQAIPVLVNAETGAQLPYHPKHLFITADWYEHWLVNWVMEHGTGPLDEEGKMPTSHFRDPREKRYVLKSFGNVVRDRAAKDGIR